MDKLSSQDRKQSKTNSVIVANEHEFPSIMHVFSSALAKQFVFAFDLALQNSRKDYYLLNKHHTKSSSQETYYTSTCDVLRIANEDFNKEEELINSIKSLKLNRRKNRNYFSPYQRKDSPITKRKEYKNLEDQLNSMHISSIPHLILVKEKDEGIDAELPEPYLQALSDDITTLSLA